VARIGVFGGTFDPPHVGHLLAACDAADVLALDQVLWVPAATQPFKADRPRGTAAEHRVAMVRRTVAGVARFTVERVEVDRGGISFMIDTLGELRRRDAQAEWVLLLGRDAAAGLEQWRAPDQVRAMARVVVLDRSDQGDSASSVDPALERVATRRVDISSTEIRQRVGDGKTIRGFVTDAVADYIAEMGLYRSIDAAS
jgi:nicotinate-nucleotide adenylyltransferase